MIHEHYSIDIGYDDDRDVIAWSEITLSGRPIAECEQSDKELLQRGLEHNAFVELLLQPKHILADIEKKPSPPDEYYNALRNNDAEREKAAKRYVDSQVNIGTQGMCRCEGFLVGAEWADSHRWHKVTDGDLPNGTCKVLICWETIKHERKWTKLAMFRRHADNHEIWYFEDSDDGVVTPDYWMEIPELPKED